MQNIPAASMASQIVDGRANASPPIGDGHHENENGIGSHVFKVVCARFGTNHMALSQLGRANVVFVFVC